MDTEGKFYLGRIYDIKKREVTAEPLLYDPDDLTTHAVVVGMTGSGKTGLCIDLLEEAALQDIPALMIDPKGDITNALLHFPDLAPQDFQPWVNPDQARRDGKTIEQAAEGAATLWRKGLAEWDIDSERIRSLQDSVHYAVFTPGSDAGIPVSILASLEAPQISWEDNRELLREKISSTVIALLGLVGMDDIDPVRSREHILLSNIFEYAWSRGKDLDLGELIMQTQNPPFTKLGVFDINAFFPQKERFELAMLLNNILAAPAFQSWIEGQPLDIPNLLYGPDGRPRHSVFYIAHLPDSERMFFVALLYSAVETWMRTQSGTSTLRAIIYFDEIFGYMPPVSNPPSKEPMLRMLKQARAFGVGQMLVTQNPVDVDYKALSNAGTWFIGKLQTDQDKQRLLDGLEGVMADDLDRHEFDKLISDLGKRVFLAKNVHERKPEVFHTRWAMNYLTGPLTRAQIPALNQMVGAEETFVSADATIGRHQQPAGGAAPAQRALKQESVEEVAIGSSTRPAVPVRTSEYFLPNNLTFRQALKIAGRSDLEAVQNQGLFYRPSLIAQAYIHFRNRKYNLDYEISRTALVSDVSRRGVVRWEEFVTTEPLDSRQLDEQPALNARFGSLEAPFSEASILRGMRTDFLDWAYRSSEVKVRVNEKLDMYAGPEISGDEFREMCQEAAEDKREVEVKKVTAAVDKKIERLQDRARREEQELQDDESELSSRKMEEWGNYAETALSLFGGRKRSLSTSLSKRRMTAKAKADVEESHEAIAEFERTIKALEQEKDEALQEIKEKWDEVVANYDELEVSPYKKDVQLDMFGVAWFPYHYLKVDGELVELPGFEGG
ncbi:helicase HerA domain-containing protein [Chloroflexota bacterium]